MLIIPRLRNFRHISHGGRRLRCTYCALHQGRLGHTMPARTGSVVDAGGGEGVLAEVEPIPQRVTYVRDRKLRLRRAPCYR